ncbi:leucine-rich repeats and immunoglobulin-like domains protein 2 isoform X2 [Pseudomyrmex gracilis]|nr:leucine-rich repeats and immunoglobulin-like domains protein 2 isoform X2 [Pseudomyrmex gracilis]XP_020299165.1 leucine-rich repeats and immunoglobulin-like domains protein 2 isoform X2 [Pseudomyrmex gracilis]
MLDLSENQLESVHSDVLKYLSDLEELDYSHNLIRNFDLSVLNTVLSKFNLSYNQINNLENSLERTKKFTRTKLKIFDVSHNNLSDLNFLNTLPEVQYLDLSFNKLSALSDSLFHLKHLEVLHIDNNQLLFLKFQHLPLSLLELNVGNNFINTLSLSFQKSFIYTLNIQNNQIFEIHKNLSSLTKLKHLNISGNLLSNFPDISLEQLEVLDLSFNNITIIPKTVSINNFPNLRILKVNGNCLKDITLRSKLELESFEANFVETIEKIDENAFLMLKEKNDCINVTISNNVKLSSIAENVFHHMNICSLDLSNNHFTYLSFELFKTHVYGKNFSNARYLINLQKNPFICDCSLQWMLDELVPKLYTIQPSLLEDLKCAGPSPLMNKRLIHWYKWKEKVFCDDFSHYAEKMAVNVTAVSNKQIVTFESSHAMIAVLAAATALLAVLTMVGVLLTRRIAEKRRRANRRF